MQPAAVSQLIADLRCGDDNAFARLVPLVYDELKAAAHRQLRRWGGTKPLCTTALAHEAYLRLADQTKSRWKDRAHFLGIAAHVMRQILIDAARKQNAQKRGGGVPDLTLDDVQPPADAPAAWSAEARAASLLDLDAALTRLAALDARAARVVELRFFGGLMEKEAAEVLDVSVSTARRDWRKARMWLMRALAAEG
jgi:RNA polymerase sigma factor (TIGR02999 family)